MKKRIKKVMSCLLTAAVVLSVPKSVPNVNGKIYLTRLFPIFLNGELSYLMKKSNKII